MFTLECPAEFRDSEFRRNFADFFPGIPYYNPYLFDRQLPLLCQPNDMTPSDREHPSPQINTSDTEFRRHFAEMFPGIPPEFCGIVSRNSTGIPYYGIPYFTEFRNAEFQL